MEFLKSYQQYILEQTDITISPLNIASPDIEEEIKKKKTKKEAQEEEEEAFQRVAAGFFFGKPMTKQ